MKHRAAGGIEAQRIAGAAAPRAAPAADDGLGADSRGRGPDEGGEREAPEAVQRPAAGHDGIGPAVDRLAPARIGAIDRRVHSLLSKAGTAGAIVAAAQPHDVGAVAPGPALAAHLEG